MWLSAAWSHLGNARVDQVDARLLGEGDAGGVDVREDAEIGVRGDARVADRPRSAGTSWR